MENTNKIECENLKKDDRLLPNLMTNIGLVNTVKHNVLRRVLLVKKRRLKFFTWLTKTHIWDKFDAFRENN